MAYDIILGSRSPRDWSLGSNLGAGFTTSTDDVEARLGTLTVDTNNLNADITAWFGPNRNLPNVARFADAWVTWRNSTYAFIKSWKEGTFKIKLAWNYMDRAEEKLRELAEWRRRWEALSGERSTAPAAPPPEKKESGGLWKWAAAIAAGGALTLLAARKIGA